MTEGETSTCKYGHDGQVGFFDKEQNQTVNFKCDRKVVAGSNYCLFHDNDYSLSHASDVLSTITNLLQQKGSNPMYFIGYKLPVEIDLTEYTTRPLYFSHCEIQDLHIHSKSAKFLTFDDGRIDNADFTNTIFSDRASFQRCVINKAFFTNVQFGAVDFRSAKFAYAEFNPTVFNDEVNFSGCIFDDVLFDRSFFAQAADFMNTSFTQVSFNNSRFQGASTFNNATITEGDFRSCTFGKCTFHKSQSQQLRFDESTFEIDVDFTESKADFITFRRTHFFGESAFLRCEFKDVDFSGAEIRTFDCYNALFEKAAFNNTQITNSNFSGSTIIEGTFAASINNVYFQETEFHEVSFSGSFLKDVLFNRADIQNGDFSNCTMNNIDFTGATFGKEDFSRVNFTGEVEFIDVKLPVYSTDMNEIPIKFDYCTFRNRVRFVGNPHELLEMSAVSLKGADLSNVEFHNVRWGQERGLLISRSIIVDEVFIDKSRNYEEVSRIYNQLRKNYESRLLFTEASNFFVGELEAIRKSMAKGSIRDKLKSLPYSIYRNLALYGESALLPLAIWTPVTILFFTILRYTLDVCSIDPCGEYDKFVDSLAAYFQIPRSDPTHTLDVIERVISAPILGTAFIAVRRKFERRK